MYKNNQQKLKKKTPSDHLWHAARHHRRLRPDEMGGSLVLILPSDLGLVKAGLGGDLLWGGLLLGNEFVLEVEMLLRLLVTSSPSWLRLRPVRGFRG